MENAQFGSPQTHRLIRTKLYVPRVHPDVVDRPRLIRKLDEARQAKLALVTAPAGYGKTTLLAKWAEQSGLPVAWVSLDDRDNDPTIFWTYFVAALQKLWPGAGNTILNMLQAPQAPPKEALLGALVEEISLIPHEFLFILDDFHSIDSADVHSSLTYLIERQPANLHLVIASREDPPLPLPRLRAQREMVEVHLTDLRFTIEEATTLFNTLLKMDLLPADIEALDQATEGWAVGLQLAAMSMQGIEDPSLFIRSFSGSQRYVFDYLAQEVLARQEPDIRGFLLKTSILDRFCGSLCDFLLDEETETGSGPAKAHQSSEILEYLERANLFLIPLDQERRWYRYHHLFAEFLQATLAQQVAPAVITALQRRASRWFTENESPSEGIDYSLRAEDYSRAAELINQIAEEMFLRSELITLRNWLNSLPAEQVARDVRLSIVFAWVLLATGQYAEMEPHLKNAQDQLDLRLVGPSPMNLPGLDVAAAQGEIACLRSSQAINRFELEEARYQGELARSYLSGRSGRGIFNDSESLRGVAVFNLAIVHEVTGEVAEASRLFEECISLSRENLHLLPMAYAHLANLMIIQGKLHQAENIFRQALRVAQANPSLSPLSGIAHTGIGNLLLEWNRLDQAEAELRRGIDLGRSWAYLEPAINGYSGLVRLRLASGDTAGAQEMINELGRIPDQAPIALPVVVLESLQAEVWMRQQKLEALSDWVSRTAPGLEESVPYVLEEQAIVLVRAYLTLGQLERAQELIQRLLPAVEGGGRAGRSIRLQLLQCLAWAAQGEHEAALGGLEETLAEAESQGYCGIFLDEGKPMERLLSAYVRQPSAGFRDYAKELLGAFASRRPDASEGRGRRRPLASSLIEPLSDREVEVLALLASGLSNREISDRLVVSLNTVKSHIKNTYGKLGVSSRTQAIARGRELGLIE